MTAKPRISVGVVTRNRPESLARTLSSLRQQPVQPFEVVISDDSDPPLAPETERIALQHACRYVRGPRRGLYANRNSIARVCQGSHLRTMDDDHLFPAGHFELCEQAVASDPRAFWSTGETGYVDGRFHAAVDRALELQPSGVGAPALREDDNWAVADGSTTFPLEVFRRGLLMVEEFGFGSSYLEFGAFLRHAGYRGRCVRGAAVEHHAGEETLRRGEDYGAGESRLFASLCYNLYFRRNLVLAARHGLGQVLLHGPRWRLLRRLPRLLTLARLRWSVVRSCGPA